MFCRLEGITIPELEGKVEAAKKNLYAVREKRVKPGRDEKVLTDWNGLMLRAFAEAAAYLGLQVDTVYLKARLRELPSVKVGRALRFDVRALERFVEQHTIETID